MLSAEAAVNQLQEMEVYCVVPAKRGEKTHLWMRKTLPSAWTSYTPLFFSYKNSSHPELP
jgi:hypothetical protein